VASKRRVAKAWTRFTGAAGGVLKTLPFILAAVFLFQYFHERVIIKPFSVPKSLSDEGVTDVVAAEELRQRIYATYQRASLDARSAKGIALSPEVADITVPGTGVTIDTIFDVLAAVLPWNTRTVISGDFIDDGGKGADNLRLTVYVNGKEVYPGDDAAGATSGRKKPTVETLLDGAADAVVAETSPLTHAYDMRSRGAPAVAARFLTQMIESTSIENGDIAQAYALRGTLWHESHQLNLACRDFAKSLEIDATSPETYRELSSLLAEEGKPDAAIAEARKAVWFTWGRDTWSYYDLGAGYYTAGAHGATPSAAESPYRLAEDAYVHAIALDDRNAYAHDALGTVITAEEHQMKVRETHDVRALEGAALAQFNTAVAQDPNHAKFLLDRADLEVEMSDWPDAGKDSARATNEDATLVQAHEIVGLVETRRQHYDDAVSEFLRALRLSHEDTYASAHLEDALERETQVQGDDRLRATVTSVFADSRFCRAGSAFPVGSVGDVLREVARIRCAARPYAAAKHALAVCDADPADRSAFARAASFAQMMPAIVMYYGFTLRDWGADHRKRIVLAAGAIALAGSFGWFLRGATAR
jgi:tetratricopeptide (TPR) repeat protein